jgi:hypothetical protein
MTQKFTIRCIGFIPERKNSLRGYANIEIAELHMVIKNVTINESHGSRWASPPGRPVFDHNGNLVRDGAKTRYANVIEFRDEATRKAFQDRVCEAVERSYPAAFE